MKKDVTFIKDPQGDNYLYLRFYLQDDMAMPYSSVVWGVPGILLLPLVLIRKLRQRFAREYILAIIIFLIAIL